MPLVLRRFIKHPFRTPAAVHHSADCASPANPGEWKQPANKASRKLSAEKVAASKRWLLGQKVWDYYWLIRASWARASTAFGDCDWILFRQNWMYITPGGPRRQLVIQGTEQRGAGMASEYHRLPRLTRRLSWGRQARGDSCRGSQAQGCLHYQRHRPLSPTERRKVHLPPLTQN